VREKEECLEISADKPKQRGFAGRQMKVIVLDKFVWVNLSNEYGKGVDAGNLPPSPARTSGSPHFGHSLFRKLSRAWEYISSTRSGCQANVYGSLDKV